MSCVHASYRIIGGNAVVADELTFGTWEGKPIRWRIVDLADGRATLLSVTAVAQEPFARDGADSAWESSDLRAWVSTEFVPGAFDEAELACVVEQVLENGAGPDGAGLVAVDADDAKTKASDTRDLVFCLSYDEVCSLLPVEARRAMAGDNGMWWLRTPGGSAGFAAYVHNNGWINTYGYNVDEAHVCVRPAVVVDLFKILELSNACAAQRAEADGLEPEAVEGAPEGADLILASAAGEELMLEVMETGELSALAEHVEAFGVDESWESFLVETLESYAEAGDSVAMEELFELVGAVEYLSRALAKALSSGNVTAARTLIRHGARLDGKCRDLHLVNDTPELRKLRKESYGADKALYEDALEGERAPHAIRMLIGQGDLPKSDFRGLLKVAAGDEELHDLYAWMLCPDHQPLDGVFARWEGKRVHIVNSLAKRDVPVSAEGLLWLWHGDLCRTDPETVRVMCPYLGVRNLDDRGELLELLARKGWNKELRTLLGVYRMFSMTQLKNGVAVAQQCNHRETAAILLDLLRSIGAGKTAQSLEL